MRPLGAFVHEPEGAVIRARLIGEVARTLDAGMLAGGIAVVTASGVSDGYFDVDLERVESDGVAVAAVDVWDSASDDSDRPWVLDWLDPDLRVQATTPSGEPLFIGIAATTDVQDYLAGSRFHVVVDRFERARRRQQARRAAQERETVIGARYNPLR